MVKIPPTRVYRLTRGKDRWEPYLEIDFESRLEDPEKKYFVLYASSSRLGCFLECLAYFRQGPTPGLDDVKHVDDDYPLPAGTVPPSWLRDRQMGSAAVEGSFADIACTEWIAKLHENRKAMRAFRFCGFKEMEIDQAALYQKSCRQFTQTVSRIVYEDGELDGIHFKSRHGSEIENWAIFHGRTTIMPEKSIPNRGSAALFTSRPVLGEGQSSMNWRNPWTLRDCGYWWWTTTRGAATCYDRRFLAGKWR